MITIRKLSTLAPSTRRRKIVRLLESWERSRELPDERYLRDLVSVIQTDVQIPVRVRDAADALAVSIDRRAGVVDLFRAINALRHALAAELGAEPADWDLLPPAGVPAARGAGAHRATAPLAGTMIYLEAIRSPFNVGSIIRTAAAFGVPLVGLSPECPAIDHPRLQRSAMGAQDAVTVCRGTLEEAVQRYRVDHDAASGESVDGPTIIALELGGDPVASFHFPKRGILLLGSEELGLTPAILSRADARISIPMVGAKAALNVGVACGIALASWTASRT